MSSSHKVDNTNTLPLLPRIVSSSIGAVITALAVQPLEVIKVRQQAVTRGSVAPSSSLISSPSVFRCLECGTFVLDTVANGGVYRGTGSGESPAVQHSKQASLGTIRMSRNIFRSQGVAGFYSGLYPSLIMSIPNTVTYFSCYDEIVSRMKGWRRRQMYDSSSNNITAIEGSYYDQILTPLVGGIGARIFATMITSPLELIRTRQAGNIASTSMMSEFRSVIRSSNSATNNLTSLYKGLVPTLWRDVPFSAIYWVGVETLKKEVFHFSEDQQEPPSSFIYMYHSFASGALSGMIAAACTTPFDVVKTRSQVAIPSSSPNIRKNLFHEPNFNCSHQGREILFPSKRNIFYQLHYIAKTEGIAALWSGNVARVLKIGPACAIMLTSYEYSKLMLLGVQ